ncbi:helicase, Snf2 family [Desulfosarcina variabilis str. Montpellier]|uniref:DEAD/DEAH box helicase n=1 Tax=Desulfosarcina variabilis TaxID=2300 RepID=UPI003AFAE843
MPIDQYLEFHRHAVARMPAAEDRHPGVAFFVGGKPSQQFCTCQKSSKRTCIHLKALMQSLGANGKARQSTDLAARFTRSLWYALAETLNQGNHLTVDSAQVQFIQNKARTTLEIKTADGVNAITYVSTDADRNRLAERLGHFSSPDTDVIPDRAEVLRRLQLLTMTEAERQLHALNMQSRRQGLEKSVWYLLAYHGFMEFGVDGCQLRPSVDEKTGQFIVTGKNSQNEAIFHIRIPRGRVQALLACLGKHLPNQHDLPVHPIPLKSLFRVSQKTQTDLDVLPVIQVIQDQGEDRFFSREDLEKFIYGDLVYIPELKILAELEKPGKSRRFETPRRMTFKKYQIPSFLETVGEALTSDGFLVDPDVKGLKLLKQWNTLKLAPSAIDRDWCWLSMDYGFGDETVSLSDILGTRKAGNRYIGTTDGWVDTHAPVMDTLAALTEDLPTDRFSKDGKSVKLSRQELFRITALQPDLPTISGTDDNAATLSRLINLEPSALPDDPSLASTLRDYQKIGLKWLWWLWENRLGGLLCDDMGLGKTHQMMALMACIQKQENPPRPILVVCPTTVLSHWTLKIKQHAPTLTAKAYYGLGRDLTATLTDTDVLVTSYGLLLRDIDGLDAIDFALAVFDEMQQIKNADTKTYAAARRIQASIKIGLSGTPIENSVLELKALMDVVVPGYLGSSDDFKHRFMDDAATTGAGGKNRAHLRRLIHPFTLRRLKSRVLEELPEKIEDIRYCELTDRQVKLYRDAIAARSQGIIASLTNEADAIPYIHIFALLTLLKQICNHPAMVDKQPVAADSEDSGKWELFKELLGESLASGQKVVVYSQFTEMIAIIADYLKDQAIGHVVLTGASRHRGRLIERFNTDPSCQVFVGSLKAGGTGIDLVAGSVVIHYDRWWNAAKEDQATDRVHRIGQQRGVQVFKLVTLGTLEEKISAIIEKKRRLMADIVREDDPGLLKAFTRKQLLEFLS